MNTPKAVLENYFSKWIFIIAITLTVALYALVIWYVWESKNDIKSTHEILLRQQELGDSIKYLDEVLTLSTRMAVATGDKEWEIRYRNCEPGLDATLKEFYELTEGTSLHSVLVRMQAARTHLAEIEHRVLALMNTGEMVEATGLISGEEYNRYRRYYIDELGQFSPIIQQQTHTISNLEREHAALLMLLGAISLCLLIFTWLRVKQLITKSVEKHLFTEEALRSSETELRALFSSMKDVILVLDKQGRYLKIVPTNPALLYKPANELIGRTLTEVFSTIEAEAFNNCIQRTIETKTTQNIEYKLTIQHTEVWFAATVSPMTEDTVIWVARDITEHKHAEEILKESEAKFRTVSETSTSAIFIYQNEEFRFVNQGALNISGYSREELFQMHFWDLIHPDYKELIKERGLRRQEGESVPSRYEFKIITKDGEERWVDFTAKPIEYQGKPAGIGTAFDITERKRVEQLQSAVYRIAETANTSSSLNELFPAVHAIIKEVMPANNFYIALLDHEAQTVNFPYFVDEVDITPPQGPVGRGLTAYVLRKGKSLLCNQECFEQMLQSGEAESVGAASPIWLGVPLIVENRTIGAMVVQHYSDPSAYTIREQQVLEFVSSEVGRAIERKWTDERLRESEERYRRLIDLSPDAIAVHVDGKIVFANKATLTLLGAKSIDEIIGKAELDFVHPENRKATAERIRKLYAEGGELPAFEEKFIRLDGTPVDVDVAASPFVFQGKKAIQVVVRNITERKQAEEAIRRSEEKYRDIFANATMGIYQSTLDGKLITANVTLAKILGYSSVEELLQCDMAKDIYWNKSERMKLIQEYEPKGKASDIEIRWKRKDGNPVWIQLNAHAIKDQAEDTMYFDGFVLDLTERKKAQEALHLQTSYYQQLFENSPAGIAVVDIHNTVLNTNRAFEKMFQFKCDELRGKRIDDFIVPEALLDEAYELTSLSQKGRTVQKESVRKRKDGTLINVAITGYPISAGTDQVAIYGMYTDITQEKKLEENLRQAQKMESLGTLAGGIAHDFNNLLAIIMGHASLLEKTKPEDPGTRKSIDTITKATHRGAGLVRQLLTFARKSHIIMESVNVNDTINELMKLLNETFPKIITINANLRNDLPMIVGDANQIHQMLLNLCVNARDAMANGGNLTISTNKVSGNSLSVQFPQSVVTEYIQIDVCDTGVGMDENTRERIFEPFFTTKERGKGTGLGLATVYGIIESHGGFMEVDSEPGQGTIFHVYFPVQMHATVEENGKQEKEHEIKGGEERILIIEDEEVLRDLLYSELTNNGYTVFTAEDGIKAIEVYSQWKREIDLVISDIGLPKMGGQEVFQKLKELNPDVKVLLASGFLDPDLKIALFKAGARGFIQKPYAPDDVLKKIRNVLD
jgi:two-component system, cell cycle sensor histidine kinase and response regulator CckA